MARDVFFDGVNINALSNIEVLGIYQNESPNIDLKKTKNAFVDGGAMSQNNRDGKVISIRARTLGDRSRYETGRRALEASLYGKINKLLQFEDEGTLITYTASPSKILFKEPIGGYCEVTILFESSLPYYTFGTPQTVSASSVNGGTTYNMGAITSYIDTPPIITITLDTFSQTTTNTIFVYWGKTSGSTTEGICRIIDTFAVNDVIVIDCQNYNVTVNGDNTIYVTNFANLYGNQVNYIRATADGTDIYDFSIEYNKRGI